MKVLFISPWTRTLYGDERAVSGHPHIGIAYLSAVLKREGHSDKVFDQAIENNDSRLFRLINSFRPHIIGITAFSYCYKYVFSLIEELKSKTSIPIIIGGPHVSAVRRRVLERTAADFAMKGEGEIALVEFLKELKRRSPNFKNVPNLIWRDSKREIIENENAPYIHDLDSLPFPDFSEFKFERYPYYQSKTIPIITSRGCPYGCNYCSVRLSMGRGFRSRSPENVVAEIEYWCERGFKNFEINDDCFSLDLDRAEKICDLIVKRGLDITYQLYNGIRVDRVSKRLLKKMKDSGCVFVSYGAESGNQKIIENIGKGIRLRQVRKAVELTNQVGIKNSVNFIIGHPGETYKTAIETVEFAKSLPTNFVNFYNVIPYPGTELFDWIEKNAKWIYHPDYIMENIGSRDLKPVFETKEFSEEERIKALKKGFALYERTILRFRFGKFLGTIIYLFTRNRALFNKGLKFALNTKFGFWLYNLLTFKSRNR
jgi:radical SAM superfamily enzyme YgiQ (UPF0313 family)